MQETSMQYNYVRLTFLKGFLLKYDCYYTH